MSRRMNLISLCARRSLTTTALLATILLTSHAPAQEKQSPHGVADYVRLSSQPHAAVKGQKCTACHTGNVTYGVWTQQPGSKDQRYISYFDTDYGLASVEGLPIGISVSKPDDLTTRLLKLDGGLIVDAVCPGQSAGLVLHDIILAANDEKLNEPDELFTSLKDGDQTVVLKVRRQGVDEVITVDRQPQPKEERYLIGVVLGELDPVVNAQLKLDRSVRVVVKDVVDDSAADGKLEPQDILLEINNEAIKDKDDVTAAVAESKGRKLALDVLRGGQTIELNVRPRRVTEASLETKIGVPLPSANVRQGVLFDPTVHYGTLIETYENVAANIPASTPSTAERLKSIEDRIERLTQLVEKLVDDK